MLSNPQMAQIGADRKRQENRAYMDAVMANGYYLGLGTQGWKLKSAADKKWWRDVIASQSRKSAKSVDEVSGC
jgi:hypothetical protein